MKHSVGTTTLVPGTVDNAKPAIGVVTRDAKVVQPFAAPKQGMEFAVFTVKAEGGPL